jgi:hypothetical protein
MFLLLLQVINRPGVLSPRQTVELYNNCRSFLSQANQMCRSVWIDFNLQVRLGYFIATLPVNLQV